MAGTGVDIGQSHIFILGGAKTTLLGNLIVTQFGAARNWPFGSALSGAVLIIMLVATLVYFRTGGRTV